MIKYLQGLDEAAESSVRINQRSVGEEEEGRGRSRGCGLGLRVRWQCRRSCWYYCSVKRTSCLVLFQGCVVLSPQQNYVYVLSHYLNSLVRTVLLVCLTTVLLAIGTTARIIAFLLYLIHTSSIIWVSRFVKELRWSEGRKR